MKATVFLLLLPLILNTSCMSSKGEFSNPDVQIIGHRGHVSTYPENTIEGFLSAVALGIEGLELDLVISADHRVVVSHEPFMKSSYMLDPNGNRISRTKERELKLYEMSYDSIRQYPTGNLPNPKFRSQRRLNTYKPLLEEVFDTVEAFRNERGLGKIKYFLEIKSDPAHYDTYQPQPREFVDLVMKIIKERNLEDQVIIMSFDASILNILKEVYPQIKVSFLWYKKGIEESLNLLTFTPEFVGPYYKQLKNAETVGSLQERGIKVVPWTVNRKRDILKMIHNGVDGIISDYPQRVLQEKNKLAD